MTVLDLTVHQDVWQPGFQGGSVPNVRQNVCKNSKNVKNARTVLETT